MELIDKTVFADLQDSAGAEFVVELVHTFLEDAPQQLDELRRSLALGDAAAFRRAAHSLKSNSHTFGALPLSALARELELSDLAALGPQAAARVEALAQAYEQAAAALRSLCHA